MCMPWNSCLKYNCMCCWVENWRSHWLHGEFCGSQRKLAVCGSEVIIQCTFPQSYLQNFSTCFPLQWASKITVLDNAGQRPYRLPALSCTVWLNLPQPSWNPLKAVHNPSSSCLDLPVTCAFNVFSRMNFSVALIAMSRNVRHPFSGKKQSL